LQPNLHDRDWRGYDIRAAVPWLLAGAAGTIALLIGRWYLEDVSDVWNRVAAIAVYLLAVVSAAILAVVFLYRAVTFTYRLTDRAVLIDRGHFSPHSAPYWLEELSEVKAGAGWVGRLLGVGWVRITTTAGREATMSGVRDPEGFAQRIREEIGRLKGAAVSPAGK
jgi:membrane protein YdbS with pleckstrin-like domain